MCLDKQEICPTNVKCVLFNKKYFPFIINKKCVLLMIKCVMLNKKWISQIMKFAFLNKKFVPQIMKCVLINKKWVPQIIKCVLKARNIYNKLWSLFALPISCFVLLYPVEARGRRSSIESILSPQPRESTLQLGMDNCVFISEIFFLNDNFF